MFGTSKEQIALLKTQLAEEKALRTALETKGLPKAADIACPICKHCSYVEVDCGIYQFVCLKKSCCTDFTPKEETPPNE